MIAIPSLWLRLWRNGYLTAFRREAWQFSTVLPVVHLLYAGLVGASLVLAWLLLLAVPFDQVSWPARLVLVGPLAYGLLVFLTRATKGRPFFIAHLVDDTAFTHEHASGTDQDMRGRLDAWADRVQAGERSASEVVVIGHSSSSFLVLEVFDRVLARDPDFGRRGTPVTLVTLGSVIPWIALDPRARALRRALRRMADADAIGWLDLRAPWDWLSIHRRSPLAVLDQDNAREDRPLIKSVAIAELIEPRTIVFRRWNFFRMHFQLLMSSRDPEAFDYIALVSGAEPVHRAIDSFREQPAPLQLRRDEAG